MKEIELIDAEEDRKVTLDPKGFFVIFLKDDAIMVEHYRNVNKGGRLKVETGELTRVIRGNSAKAICDTFMREELISRMDHMAYLSRELQKAELALIHGLEYEQSKPLKV